MSLGQRQPGRIYPKSYFVVGMPDTSPVTKVVGDVSGTCAEAMSGELVAVRAVRGTDARSWGRRTAHIYE